MVRERKPWATMIARISRALWMICWGVDDHFGADAPLPCEVLKPTVGVGSGEVWTWRAR